MISIAPVGAPDPELQSKSTAPPVTTTSVGSDKSNEAVTSQPLASVIVTLYVPAPKLDRSSEVEPVAPNGPSQRYV